MKQKTKVGTNSGYGGTTNPDWLNQIEELNEQLSKSLKEKQKLRKKIIQLKKEEHKDKMKQFYEWATDESKQLIENFEKNQRKQELNNLGYQNNAGFSQMPPMPPQPQQISDGAIMDSMNQDLSMINQQTPQPKTPDANKNDIDLSQRSHKISQEQPVNVLADIFATDKDKTKENMQNNDEQKDRNMQDNEDSDDSEMEAQKEAERKVNKQKTNIYIFLIFL